MDWANETTRTVDLGYDQLLTFEGRPGTRVRVLYGSMWLTEEGNERDLFAACGEEVTLSSRGRSVIEGLGAARVQLVERARRSGLTSLAGAVSGLWHRLRPRGGLPEVAARSVIVMLAVVVGIGVLQIAASGPLWLQSGFAPGANATAQWQSQVAAVQVVRGDVAAAATGFLAVN